MSKFCSNCGQSASGNFCNNCGASLTGASKPAGAAPTPAGSNRLPWIVGGIAFLAVVALVLVQTAKQEAPAASDGATPLGPMQGGAAPFAGGAGGPAVDISKMSPQERADRLFNRVMRYASEGKMDSAAIFAPMAMQSFEMMAPLDVHGHFDLGLVAIVAGDAKRAREEADSILKKNDKDLLGLTLAIRAAESAKDNATRAKFEQRLIANEVAERKTNRPEYMDHGQDIDAALKEAKKKN